MTVSWQQLEAESDVRRAWREVGAGSSYTTFFHTEEWADVFCSAVPEWQPDPVVIEFEDGNVAVVPMLRHLGSEHRQSMAPYVYGGPVFLHPPEDAHMYEIGKIPRWYTDIVLYDNPFSPYAWEQEGLVRWRIHTHVLELSSGFDEVYAGLRSMMRRHCRAAEKAGVSVGIAGNLRDVDEYYEAYLDSLHRWGDGATSRYPRSLFRALFERQEAGGGVRLWVGSVNGQVVSGVLVLYHGVHSVVWHAANHSEHLSSNASSLVYLTAIRDACARGLRWFDFNPSGSLRGVEFFKESFGARRVPFDMYHSPSFTRAGVMEADAAGSGTRDVRLRERR